MARRGRPPRPGGRSSGRKRKQGRQRSQPPARFQVPDTDVARLEEQTRADVTKLMAHQRQDLGLLESERLLARVVDQHPEYRDVFEAASDHLSTGEESSPFVHVALHRIVEERVISREIGSDMSRFGRDKPWHEAVHEAAEMVAEELFTDERRAHSEQEETAST